MARCGMARLSKDGQGKACYGLRRGSRKAPFSCTMAKSKKRKQMTSPDQWHLYTAAPMLDYNWESLATVKQTVNTISVAGECPGDTSEVGFCSSKLLVFLRHWDEARSIAAKHGWEGTCKHEPVVFWLPNVEGFEYGFVIKMSANGEAFVISPQLLPWMEKYGSEMRYQCYLKSDGGYSSSCDAVTGKWIGTKHDWTGPQNYDSMRFSDWYEKHEICRATAYEMLGRAGVKLQKRKIEGVSHPVTFLEGDALNLMEEWISGYKQHRFIRDMKGSVQQKVKPKLRVEILARDNYTCQMCGINRKDGAILEIDHIHPVSRGGTNDPKNLQVLCRECNGGKSNRIVLGQV